ncbi:MAG: hypothetical protein DDT37_01913 [Firmicutes bacterium]|nr:hypothetical protein [candidate division NPL-UPA2 bacterium]
MGKAELHNGGTGFHEFLIGAEVVATDNAVKCGAQESHQNFRAASAGDVEEGELARPKAPCPKLFSGVFVAGFIDAEPFLPGQRRAEFFIGCRESIGNFAGHCLGKHSPTHFDIKHIGQERLDGAVGSMTCAFEITDK